MYRHDFKLSDKGLFAAWFLWKESSLASFPGLGSVHSLQYEIYAMPGNEASLFYIQAALHHTYLSLYCVCAITPDGAKGSQKS